jgi:hypothetical protein
MTRVVEYSAPYSILQSCGRYWANGSAAIAGNLTASRKTNSLADILGYRDGGGSAPDRIQVFRSRSRARNAHRWSAKFGAYLSVARRAGGGGPAACGVPARK